MLGVGAVFFNMIKAFLVPIILAAVFASLFYPFYEWLLRVTRGRRGMSALICCAGLSVGAMLPAYGVARLIASEAIRLYEKNEQRQGEMARADARPAAPSITERIQNHPLARRLHLDPVHWQSSFEHIMKRVAELLVTLVARDQDASDGRLGFLDGREGLLLHLYHSAYVSWKYAKAWELGRKK